MQISWNDGKTWGDHDGVGINAGDLCYSNNPLCRGFVHVEKIGPGLHGRIEATVVDAEGCRYEYIRADTLIKV